MCVSKFVIHQTFCFITIYDQQLKTYVHNTFAINVPSSNFYLHHLLLLEIFVLCYHYNAGKSVKKAMLKSSIFLSLCSTYTKELKKYNIVQTRRH